MGFTVGIVGLGLMGGSAAKALKAHTTHSVFGEDANADTVAAACSEGVLDGILDTKSIPQCDLLFVALYPRDTVEWVRRNARNIRRGALLIDLCGVKRTVCAAISPIAKAHGFTFIGGHPMAGVARFGYFNADKDMFLGASMLLTPDAPLAEDTWKLLCGLFGAMGFRYLKLTDPDEHDRMIAYTSQLAHVPSSAYAQSPSAARHTGFSAGSLKDMTRVATLNVDMWAELFLENREYLAEEIEALIARLHRYTQALRANDEETVSQLLELGCAAKRNMEEEEARYANGAHPGIQTL